MFSHKEHRLLLPVSHVQSMSQTFLSLCPFAAYNPSSLCGLFGEARDTIVIWASSSVVFCLGFPGGWDGKESACTPGFDPWVKKISGRKEWQSTPVFLPGKSNGQRSLVGYSPWGCKKLDMTEWLTLCNGLPPCCHCSCVHIYLQVRLEGHRERSLWFEKAKAVVWPLSTNPTSCLWTKCRCRSEFSFWLS